MENGKKQYRITWRHEVIIEAQTKEEAQKIWENLSLGNLDRESSDRKIWHEFIEKVSFEDESHNDL